MKEYVILYPLLIPVFTAICCLFFWKRTDIQKYLFLAGSAGFFVSTLFLFNTVYNEGPISIQGGGWPAPFGISLVADLLSSIMLVATGVISFAISFYSLQSVDKDRISYGFFPVLQFLTFGLCGAFLSGDVFNLYVWFEVMLVSSFVLLSLGGTKPQLEGTIKYVAINFIASAIFLAGIGILYGLTGTVNMADLARLLPEVENAALLNVAAAFFVFAFGIKAAIFPMFFWLPASYHTPPIAISSFIAGLLTKVGVYALIRFFTLIFTVNMAFIHETLLLIAGFTMVVGVLGAAAQNDFRKILSFHIVSQIGYMIMGLAFYTPLAIAGAIFFVVHNIIVKTNLFLISGIVRYVKGSYKLKKLGGVYDKFPLIAVLFAISAFALTGIPPLSGFWPKFMLIKAGLTTGEIFISLVALGVSILTMYSMTKIWNEVFWKEKAIEYVENVPQISFKTLMKKKYMMVLSVLFLGVLILAMGLFAGPLVSIAMATAEQLLNPDIYINTVFGIENNLE
jgi:multicomponent Na+:H+ antiporter subunit D